MAEKPTSSPIPLEQMRDERSDGIELCDKLIDYLHLPGTDLTGEGLYDTLEEIFRVFSFDTGVKPDGIKIDKQLQQFQNITQRHTAWKELLQEYINHKNTFDIGDFDALQKAQGTSLFEIIMDTLKYGAQKEDSLQKIKALQSYHLPKTAAFWSSVLMEVTQEFGEDALGRENINKYIYSAPIARLYDRLLDPLRTDVRLRRSRIELSSDLRKAQEIINQAQPAMDRELARKGLNDAARKKLYGRAVVFLAEDPIGRKVASMVSQTAESAVGKSAGSIFSGMREGFVSPLCAAMFALSIDGAPDKEKAIIQYFTFLFAGQLAQEGAKPLGNWLVKFLEKMSPKGDTRLAKIGKYLMSDVPKSKLAIITASVAVVCAVFKIKFVEEKISGIAEWLDQNIPHGKWREATGNAFQIVGTIAGWELVLGWEVMKETTGMNGVNPFRDQFDFLRENLGQEGVDAWNKKVSDVQNGGMAEQVFGIKNGPTQKAIMEEQKISSPMTWAEQNIIPFQLQLDELNTSEDALFTILRNLPRSPSSSEPLLGKSEELRYREYALAESDIWNTRDHLAEDESNILTIGITKFNRLTGLNDTAIIWLEDMEGSPEDRIDTFFENLDSLIASEKQKQGDDVEALKKIEPWITAVKEAKKQWMTLRSIAIDLAKRVTVARSLGVYNQSQWSESFLNQESLAFKGFIDKVARDSKMRELTTPNNGADASGILDAAGSDVRMYGDDILDAAWRERRDNEYNEWVKIRGLGIDDRHVHLNRVKQLIQAAYTGGVPIEYIEKALEPVSAIARNQGEGKYVTPDMVRVIENSLAKYLLDKALRDAIAEGKTLDTLSQVSFTCPGYTLSRTFTRNKKVSPVELDNATPEEEIIIQDSVYSVSYRALFGGEHIQESTSERSLGSQTVPLQIFIRKIQNIELNIRRQKEKEVQAEIIESARLREDHLLRQQKIQHKNESETNFIEYYNSSDLTGRHWTQISKTTPVIFAGIEDENRKYLSAQPEAGWGWESPRSGDALKVVVYFGPNDVKEVTLTNIADFSSLSDTEQALVRETIVSGKLDDTMRELIKLTSGSALYEKKWHIPDGALLPQSYVATERDMRYELLKNLQPHYEQAGDKGEFLKKLLSALVKYKSISGETTDKILGEVIR